MGMVLDMTLRDIERALYFEAYVVNRITSYNVCYTKLLRTLNEVPGKFVRTLAAVRDQKEKQAA